MASDPVLSRQQILERLQKHLTDDFSWIAVDVRLLRAVAQALQEDEQQESGIDEQAGKLKYRFPSDRSDAALVPRLRVLREWLTTWVATGCGCAGCRRDIQDFLDADAENGLAARVREGA